MTRPSVSGEPTPTEWTAPSIQEALERPLSEHWVGRVTAQPSGLRISVQDGVVSGVEGHLTLGQIVVQERLLSAEQIENAMEEGTTLGRTLLQKGLLRPQQLQQVLAQQATQALQFLKETPPSRYQFEEQPRLPWPHAGLALSEIRRGQGPAGALPLDQMFRLAPQTSDVMATPPEWELLRWLNGRRTLRRAIEISGLSPDVGEAAASGLLQRGLLETSAVAGLRMLVVQLRPNNGQRQPPASIRANLFLRHLDGEKDIQSIVDRLNYPLEEAALLVTGLYRDDAIEVIRGQREMKRLLEEY